MSYNEDFLTDGFYTRLEESTRIVDMHSIKILPGYGLAVSD